MNSTIEKIKKEDPLKDLPALVLWLLLILMYGLLIRLLMFTAPQISYFIVMVLDNKQLSEVEQYEHVLNYAIALEVIVFVVTAMGNTKAAKWFIFISILSQLLSMHKWDGILMESVWKDPMSLSTGLRFLSGSLIVSIMSGIGIHFISLQIKNIMEYLRVKYSKKKRNYEEDLNLANKRSAEAEIWSEVLQNKLTWTEKELSSSYLRVTEAEKKAKAAELLIEEADQKRIAAESKLTRKKSTSPQITV